MGEAASESYRVDGGGGVATTDESVSAGSCDRLSYTLGSDPEVGDLENAHRPVPHNGAGAPQTLTEIGHGLGADVERDPARIDGVGGKGLERLARLNLLRADQVGGQPQP